MNDLRPEEIKAQVESALDQAQYDEQSDIDISIDVPTKEKKIVWQPKDLSIRDLANQRDDGDLILQPDYQRKFVMKRTQSSRLIESILMNVPIPTIYLAEEEDATLSVIDGQQRLTSFISFIRGHFPDGAPFKLSGLKVLPELNRKAFIDLAEVQQRTIKKTTLHCIIINNESHPDIKFEIFERLNTGSIKLNEDEIRNTVYRGSLINLLADLENNEMFHALVRKDNFKTRMIYRGMILRYFALMEKSYINYKPSMKQFSNKYLRDHRNITADKATELTAVFKKSVELVKVVFGDKAFRRYIPGSDDDPNGKWSVSRINMALFDIQMTCFAIYDKNQIIPKADAIREALMTLMTTDQKFIDSILIQTSNKETLQTRFRIWMDTLSSIAHRYCNRAKSNK